MAIGKRASENDELDLNQISAAQFLAGIESGEIVDADEDDEIDLSQMSGADLLELEAQIEAEKVASSDEGQHFYALGQQMAQGFADALSGPGGYPDEIDVEDISGQEMVELLNSGEYELDKTAGVMSRIRGAVGGAVDALRGGGKKRAQEALDRYASGTPGGRRQTFLRNQGKENNLEAIYNSTKGGKKLVAARDAASRKTNMARGAAGAAGVAALGLGGAAAYKKKGGGKS